MSLFSFSFSFSFSTQLTLSTLLLPSTSQVFLSPHTIKMATNTMVPPVRAATNGSTVNGNHTNGNYTNGNYTNGNATYGNSNQLQPSDTISSVNFPRDLFEQLYLSPENRVKGDLRKTFGNPTPL
jgi:hypothetical protein